MRALLAIAAAIALVATGLTTAAPRAEAVSTERLAGADRYETSVEVSRAAPATTTVFLANGQKFPDALAAGPVVAAEQGHLLLTRPNELLASVARRIAELAPTEIVVVGSEASVSAAVAAQASAISGAEVTRLGGANRVETSLALFDRLLESGPVESVWVASGHSFPDALVAASVAGRDRSAVILDHHGPSPAASEAWLDRVETYSAGRAVRIAGGEPSVSAADAAGLRERGATEVTRYAGENRYATARAINDAFATEWSDARMLLATGTNFPDALSGAVLSALRGYPLFLTPSTCNASIAAMLRAEAAERQVHRVIGLGGPTTVSDRALRHGMCQQDLRVAIGQTYGTFPSRTYSGSGFTTIDLGRSIRFGLVEATFTGSGASSIRALDAARSMVSSVVEHRSVFSGTGLVAPNDGVSSTRYLEISARGAWRIEVRDLTTAPILPERVDRAPSGGGVFLHDGPAAYAEVSHHGDGWFHLDQLTRASTPDYLLSNCCDRFRQSTSLAEGPTVIAVVAAYEWSLRRS